MISVVIPLYNKEQSIASTLQSVLAQTCTDYEIVVVDDGSTDNSAAVVKSIMENTDKIRLIAQSNAGVSAARNAGILAAKGEHIAFLDGDDLWSPLYLTELASLIVEFPNAGLYAIGNKQIAGDEIPSLLEDEKKIYRGWELHPWNTKFSIWTGSSSSSKQRLISLGLFDTRMTHGEDLDMWWRLILDGGVVVSTRTLAFYRQDTENRAMHRVIPLEKHIPYYIDKFADARAKDVEFRRFFDREMIYRLYPYLLDKHYRSEAKRQSRKLDYSLQKRSMKLRMQFPFLYKLYLILNGRI